DRSIWNRCTGSPLLRGLQIKLNDLPFDARQPASWYAIAADLEDQFRWLTGYLVTHKRALTRLAPLAVRPAAWDAPALLEKQAALRCSRIRFAPPQVEGVPVTPRGSTAEAERFLV